MTQEEIKKSNRRLGQMNRRNQGKLERLGVIVPNKTKKVKGVEICDECGNILPEPKYEQREGGYSESVINCACGATYVCK